MLKTYFGIEILYYYFSAKLVVKALLHKSLSDPYQSRFNSIPLVGPQGIRANQFNNTSLSMSIRTRSLNQKI